MDKPSDIHPQGTRQPPHECPALRKILGNLGGNRAQNICIGLKWAAQIYSKYGQNLIERRSVLVWDIFVNWFLLIVIDWHQLKKSLVKQNIKENLCWHYCLHHHSGVRFFLKDFLLNDKAFLLKKRIEPERSSGRSGCQAGTPPGSMIIFGVSLIMCYENHISCLINVHLGRNSTWFDDYFWSFVLSSVINVHHTLTIW